MNRTGAVILLLAAAIARLLFHWLTGFTGDDAYITFRYAEHIATGLGFVYNPGQPVLGSTTPLFALMLAAFKLIGVSIPTAALVMSLAASGVTAVVVYRIASELQFGAFAWVPSALYILFPRSLSVDSSGMETALFTMLVVLALYLQLRRWGTGAVFVACLAVLTRPEGQALLGLLLLDAIIRHRGRIGRALLVMAVMLAPWVVFATVYFGSPIPNTILAKAALFQQSSEFTRSDTFVYLMGLHTPLGWMMTAMAAPGVYWTYRRVGWGILETAWIVVLVGGYTLTRARIFPWYIVPIYPLLLIFVVAGLMQIAEWMRLRIVWQAKPAAVIGAVLCAILLAADYKPMVYNRHVQQAYESVHRAIGLYLREHAAPDELVAAQDIGYIGYFSRRKILDRDGLVSPEVIPYNRDGRHLELLIDFRPEWVVVSRGSPLSDFEHDERFHEVFALQETFVADRFTYDVYRRRDLAGS